MIAAADVAPERLDPNTMANLKAARELCLKSAEDSAAIACHKLPKGSADTICKQHAKALADWVKQMRNGAAARSGSLVTLVVAPLAVAAAAMLRHR